MHPYLPDQSLSETKRLHYRILPPSAQLAPYVRYYRVLRSTGYPASFAYAPSLPNGTVDLMIAFSPVRRLVKHTRSEMALWEHTWVVGPGTEADVLEFHGVVDLLNVNFKPGGAAAFFGPALDDLRHAWVPLDSVWTRWSAQFVRDMQGSPLTERIRRLETLLCQYRTDRRIRTVSAPPADLIHALHIIETNHGRHSVQNLSTALWMSERKLTRLFQQYVGVSPKDYSRLMRFWHALKHVFGNSEAVLAQAALDSGYYDQAHMTNEFTTITGLPPAQFLEFWKVGGLFQDTTPLT